MLTGVFAAGLDGFRSGCLMACKIHCRVICWILGLILCLTLLAVVLAWILGEFNGDEPTEDGTVNVMSINFPDYHDARPY